MRAACAVWHARGAYNEMHASYWQTGAGKSYSFVGYGANKGILPIVSNEIFQKVISLQSQLSLLTYDLHCAQLLTYLLTDWLT